MGDEQLSSRTVARRRRQQRGDVRAGRVSRRRSTRRRADVAAQAKALVELGAVPRNRPLLSCRQGYSRRRRRARTDALVGGRRFRGTVRASSVAKAEARSEHRRMSKGVVDGSLRALAGFRIPANRLSDQVHGLPAREGPAPRPSRPCFRYRSRQPARARAGHRAETVRMQLDRSEARRRSAASPHKQVCRPRRGRLMVSATRPPPTERRRRACAAMDQNDCARALSRTTTWASAQPISS